MRCCEASSDLRREPRHVPILALLLRARNPPGKVRGMPNATLSASAQREISVAASCDPRTLRRYLDGEVVAPMCAARIERALTSAGLQEHIAAAYARRRSTVPPSSNPPTAA
jgi:hypothetical protein